MLLIYTHKITPRFTYIMKQIFTRILGIEITYTTKVEDFIKHTGPKITYTKQPLQNEFFIRSNELVFDQGIDDIQVAMGDWEGLPCFFATGERSTVPFDIFSASFYLLSRYEEYLPHIKDLHGRFSPKESLAYKHNFLQLPIVDLWAFKFFEKLKERFPEILHVEKQYRYTSIVDVTSSHGFAYKGLVRSIAGVLLDLSSFKIRRMARRILVWTRIRKDPYDNFAFLIALHKEKAVRSMFFFLFAEYSTYDKNVSPNNNKFRYLIKSIADYSMVSLTTSYASFGNLELLKKEKKRLADVINRPINYSRSRYNRVDVPDTYRDLVAAGFTDDYTMGYTHEIGFRAGTCSSFYFYDITLEVQQPIRVHPFAIHDYALLDLKDKNEVLANMQSLYESIKYVNGDFITIFSNELLGAEHHVDWKDLYNSVLEKYAV